MITTAIKMALTSQHSQKVGCVITDKRGRIISTGVNSTSKTHPLQAKFANMLGFPHRVFLHAEIHALVRCRETPHTLYVARVRKDGELGLAKPCPICQMAIKAAGVKKVVYTNEVGVLQIA